MEGRHISPIGTLLGGDLSVMQLAVAGEALHARSAHGSLGVFPGFVLIIISEVLISFVMLKGRLFSKITAWLGLTGNSLLFIYIILVTFVPAMKSVAMLIAAPGGLLALAWMIIFTGRLFKLGR